jgi:hypothetical protein
VLKEVEPFLSSTVEIVRGETLKEVFEHVSPEQEEG